MIIIGYIDVGDIRLVLIEPEANGLTGVGIFEDRYFLLCISDGIAFLRFRLSLLLCLRFRLRLLLCLRGRSAAGHQLNSQNGCD